MQSNLNTVIFLPSIDSIVMGVNVDDFKGNDSVFCLVKTREWKGQRTFNGSCKILSKSERVSIQDIK
jgi:hypothetical protein